jgi:alkylhydroperoxidase/carboxymuconolactone decarboxylase family protein YurZ
VPSADEGDPLGALLEQIGRLAPESAAGYRRIRAVIESDGALGRAHKALLVAVNAALCGDGELAARELARGRREGLAEREIATAAAALLLSRGESACGRFVAVTGQLSADGPAFGPAAPDAVAYFREYNRGDALPARLALLAERSPQVFDGYFRMHHAVLAAERDEAKLAELVLCSLNAAALAGPFVAIHAATARRAGVTDEQLVEAVLCAIPVAGVAAWAAAAGALFPDAAVTDQG